MDYIYIQYFYFVICREYFYSSAEWVKSMWNICVLLNSLIERLIYCEMTNTSLYKLWNYYFLCKSEIALIVNSMITYREYSLFWSYYISLKEISRVRYTCWPMRYFGRGKKHRGFYSTRPNFAAAMNLSRGYTRARALRSARSSQNRKKTETYRLELLKYQ